MRVRTQHLWWRSAPVAVVASLSATLVDRTPPFITASSFVHPPRKAGLVTRNACPVEDVPTGGRASPRCAST